MLVGGPRCHLLGVVGTTMSSFVAPTHLNHKSQSIISFRSQEQPAKLPREFHPRYRIRGAPRSTDCVRVVRVAKDFPSGLINHEIVGVNWLFMNSVYTTVPAVNKVHEFCLQASRRHEAFMNIHERAHELITRTAGRFSSPWTWSPTARLDTCESS